MLFDQGNPYRNGLPDILRLEERDFEFGISPVNLEAVNRNTSWSVFTFMAADDPALSASMFDDLLEMKAIGSSSDVHVSAIFIGPMLTDSLFLRLNRGSAFADDIILRFFRIRSDPKILKETITNNAIIYPAEKRMLILSGHGNGWKGLLPDFQTWRMYMHKGLILQSGDVESNLRHLQGCHESTIGAIRSRFGPDEDYYGARFDVVAFDACGMANVEAMMVYADHVPFIVASEGAEPGSGYPYDLILKKLTDDPGMDPGELASQVVASVADFYRSAVEPGLRKMITQAVFDGTHLHGLCGRIGSLAQALSSSMKKGSVLAIRDCIDQSCSFTGGFMDIIGFALNLEGAWISPEISMKARSLIDFYEHSGLVVHKEVAGGKNGPNGLSIYAPRPGDFSQDYIQLLPLLPAEFSQWKQFLEEYHSELSDL